MKDGVGNGTAITGHAKCYRCAVGSDFAAPYLASQSGQVTQTTRAIIRVRDCRGVVQYDERQFPLHMRAPVAKSQSQNPQLFPIDAFPESNPRPNALDVLIPERCSPATGAGSVR